MSSIKKSIIISLLAAICALSAQTLMAINGNLPADEHWIEPYYHYYPSCRQCCHTSYYYEQDHLGYPKYYYYRCPDHAGPPSYDYNDPYYFDGGVPLNLPYPFR